MGRVPAVAAAACLLLLQGCYYVQAVRGHMAVMHSRRPVSEVIADPATPEALRERLETVREARAFAVEALGLPDNDSYRSYADVGRDYVVWNVFAAPEFSLEPKQWCFPIAGCVAYRGYFSQSSAEDEAQALRRGGFDVVVGGVAAYSTLGRFADPVLSTMMQWNDTYIVATLFHELAHQVLYVKGDTRFNESFASAVADIGTRRWLASREDEDALARYDRNRQMSEAMLDVIQGHRDELAALYASELPAVEMRRRKQEIFERLAGDLSTLVENAQAGADAGFTPPLNNAGLVSFGLYEGWAEAFQRLLEECNGALDCFYRRSRELADLPAGERDARMTSLGKAGAGARASPRGEAEDAAIFPRRRRAAGLPVRSAAGRPPAVASRR